MIDGDCDGFGASLHARPLLWRLQVAHWRHFCLVATPGQPPPTNSAQLLTHYADLLK
ncbi:hypothetical protein BDV98DRAFT_566673 [Pterulicium gracile]|uniref:Uncharacterized protein n=1 Tax=Pterulicium gracile TaxID=1884261 RepID=A0A5C3QLQ9_9AGAR|nr:hypothetical protein BDV98DRAFT_566673 [Pterula gracilis]